MLPQITIYGETFCIAVVARTHAHTHASTHIHTTRQYNRTMHGCMKVVWRLPKQEELGRVGTIRAYRRLLVRGHACKHSSRDVTVECPTWSHAYNPRIVGHPRTHCLYKHLYLPDVSNCLTHTRRHTANFRCSMLSRPLCLLSLVASAVLLGTVRCAVVPGLASAGNFRPNDAKAEPEEDDALENEPTVSVLLMFHAIDLVSSVHC